MANVPDTRTARSIGNNTDLAPMASYPERIFRRKNPSFQTAFANPDMCHDDDDDQVEALEQAFKSENEGSQSLLAREPAHLAARFTHGLLAFAEFFAIVQLVAQKEAERNYASRANTTRTRAAMHALSDAFQIGYESANAGLKNNLFHLIESVLTIMAYEGALDRVFD